MYENSITFMALKKSTLFSLMVNETLSNMVSHIILNTNSGKNIEADIASYLFIPFFPFFTIIISILTGMAMCLALKTYVS